MALSPSPNGVARAAAIRFGVKGEGPAEGRWQLRVGPHELTVNDPGAFKAVDLPAVPHGACVEATLTGLDQPAADEQPPFLSFASLLLDCPR